MKILRVADIPDSRTGGMARAMRFSGEAMERAGHRIDYLFRDGIGPAPVERLRRFWTPLRLPFLVRWLCRAAGGYDVVEIHEPLGGPYGFARMSGRRLPPLVLFSHGLEARSRLAMMRYKRGKRLPVPVRERMSSLAVACQAEYALRHCDHIICLSTEDEGFLETSGISTDKITRVPLGVGEAFRSAPARGCSSQVPSGRLLFVGNWLLRKGVMDLAEAVTRVLRRHGGVTLTVAGCGPVEAQVHVMFPPDLRARVSVIPALSDDAQLVDLYARHSVLVLPSYMEGQPLVMLEAAVMGLAVVASDTSGMRDFVNPEGAGVLVPVGQSHALAEALDRLVTDEKEIRRLGATARAKALGRTWEQAAAAMVGAYARAISRSRLRYRERGRVSPEA